MQNKNFTVFLILGAFVLGFVFFWAFDSISKSKVKSTEPSTTDLTESDSKYNEKETTKSEDTKTPEVQKRNSLNLSGQGLEKLPSYVLSRTDLEELNISNNKLTGALPSEIGKLKRLKVLNASNNLMTGVPAEIGHLPDLEILDLSSNELTGLPNELAELKKLKVLNLSGNDYSKQDLDIIRKGLSPDVNIIL
jgi:Leucine-rich repeat (LRR) protein